MGKKSKSFLPKKIGGVKVPKSVRKGRLGELLASPTGQALIAEAVTAAGAAAGAKTAADSTDAHDDLAYALGEAARSFTDALNRRRTDGDDRALSGPAPQGREAADSKKKPASDEAGAL